MTGTTDTAPFVSTPLTATLAPTPWNDTALGGPTATLTFGDLAGYAAAADLRRRDPWLADRLAAAGYAYVGTMVAADDHLAKAVVQHLGFDFIYQTTTCILNLTADHAAFAGHPELLPVAPDTVAAAEVAELCARTMKVGRLYEDFLTRDAAAPRTLTFIGELHQRPGVHRVFTRSPAGHLNGYAYIPISGSSADLSMMGLDERHAPAGAGELLWRLSLAELVRGKLARRVHTRVPAANLGVLNIYARLGFSFIRPAYEFRLLPQQQR